MRGNTMTLAELLRQRRALYGFSLDRARQEMGISKGHLHDMEAGKAFNPSLHTIKAICRVYGVSAKQILSVVDPS